MIELVGEKVLSQAPDGVLSFLSDPRQFSTCLGTAENLRVEENGDFSAKFRVEVPRRFGISYLENVSATMTFKLRREAGMVEWDGSGRSLGSKMTVTLRIDTKPAGDGTHLSWRATLGAGLAEKLLGEKGMREIATDLSSQILDCISSKMGSSSAQTRPESQLPGQAPPR